MDSERNQFSEDERLYATVVNSAGTTVTGDVVLLSIQRESDGYWYDFTSTTFKNAGWLSSSATMTELDAVRAAGTYYYDFDASAQGIFSSQKNYLIRAESVSGANNPLEGYLKLGGWIDSVGISGGGASFGITADQAQDIADRVWKVVLRGKETAKDVLLSKSEFDVTKDYVLTISDPKLEGLLKEIKKIKFPDNSDKIIKALDRLKPINFNPILEKVLDKITLTASFFETGKNDIIKSINSQEKYDDQEVKLLIEELKTTISLLQEDIGERIDVAKTISEEIGVKSEEIGDGHQEKMHEMMMKLESESEENKKNIKKILLKMTELKFDSDNSNIEDFEYIKDTLSLIMDSLNI